jgi:hypothetical protein
MYCKAIPLAYLCVIALCSIGCTAPKPAETTPAPTTTSETKPEPAVKWYQLLNVTIPPDCSLRSQANITKPPSIFVEIKKNGTQIMRSVTQKGWTVDYPKKGDVFPVSDEPDAIYTIQVWDDCWANQNIDNITGLKSTDFAGTVRQKGGQYDTPEQLMSVQFKEVPAP